MEAQCQNVQFQKSIPKWNIQPFQTKKILMTFVQSSGMLLAFLTNAFTIFVEKSPSPVVHAHNGLGTISVCNYNGVLRLTLISFDLYLIPVVFA